MKNTWIGLIMPGQTSLAGNGYIHRLSRYLFYFVLSFLFTLINSNNPFFWDSVIQVSVPANFYFKNDFSNLFLPSASATGHQPFVGMYVALMWKIFGRSLLVSHIAMLPFVFGILCQIDKLVFRAGLKKIESYMVILITICDATFLSQMSMITFDIPHIFFFLWSVNSILNGGKISLSIAYTFLMLTSLRGSLSGFGILLFILINSLRMDTQLDIKKLLPLIPGLIAFMLFLVSFLHTEGWMIFNPGSSNFKEFGSFATAYEILRNIGLVGWRLIDFGRVGIWLVFLFIIYNAFTKRTLFDEFYSDIFFISVCQFAVFFFVVIIFKNPFGHRYFLPVIIPVSIAVTYWVMKYSRYRFMLYTILISILITGYFWIYPPKIAKGWDATPAHWAYFKVLREMSDKIVQAKISFTDIGSFSPIEGSAEYNELKENGRIIGEAKLDSDKYVLYSNVCNIEDRYIDELFDIMRWEPFIEVRQNMVFIILFKRKADIFQKPDIITTYDQIY